MLQQNKAATTCFLSLHGTVSSTASEIKSTLDSSRNCQEVRENVAQTARKRQRNVQRAGCTAEEEKTKEKSIGQGMSQKQPGKELTAEKNPSRKEEMKTLMVCSADKTVTPCNFISSLAQLQLLVKFQYNS